MKTIKLNEEQILKLIRNKKVNVDRDMVVCVSCEARDSEFRIRFTPDKEISIIICPITEVINNTRIIYEKKMDNDYSKEQQIGLYRRLSNSCYFFRIDVD